MKNNITVNNGKYVDRLYDSVKIEYWLILTRDVTCMFDSSLHGKIKNDIIPAAKIRGPNSRHQGGHN